MDEVIKHLPSPRKKAKAKELNMEELHKSILIFS